MGTTKKVTLEDAWKVIRRVGRLQEETDKKIRELTENIKQTDEQLKKTDEQLKKTDEQLKKTDEQLKKTDEQVKKTDEQVNKTTESINQANGNFNTKWGTFLENLVKGDLVGLLRTRGIEVERILSKLEFSRPDGSVGGEYDLVALGGGGTVVVEVKTSLKTGDVDGFLKNLKNFKKNYPEYGYGRLYGALAYLGSADRSPKTYALKKGLFLIQSPGGKPGVSTIVNARDFKPREF